MRDSEYFTPPRPQGRFFVRLVSGTSSQQDPGTRDTSFHPQLGLSPHATLLGVQVDSYGTDAKTADGGEDKKGGADEKSRTALQSLDQFIVSRRMQERGRITCALSLDRPGAHVVLPQPRGLVCGDGAFTVDLWVHVPSSPSEPSSDSGQVEDGSETTGRPVLTFCAQTDSDGISHADSPRVELRLNGCNVEASVSLPGLALSMPGARTATSDDAGPSWDDA